MNKINKLAMLPLLLGALACDNEWRGQAVGTSNVQEYCNGETENID